MYLPKHPSIFCSWLFRPCKEKWPSGFRIIALYIFRRYIPDLSRKQMSVYWLKGDQIASALEIILNTQLIMGGCLKPLCPPSLSGQTPTFLWAVIKESYSWCAPSNSLCYPWWTFPKVQAELNPSGHYHTADGFTSQNTSMCQEKHFKKWIWLWYNSEVRMELVGQCTGTASCTGI